MFNEIFVEIASRKRTFAFVVLLLLVFAAVIYPYPTLASWFGFLIAGYAVVANDSIQTVGTFIASNQKQPWWVLWLFIGGVVFAHCWGKLDIVQRRCFMATISSQRVYRNPFGIHVSTFTCTDHLARDYTRSDARVHDLPHSYDLLHVREGHG